jgi:phenol 2-monooxygenase
VGINYQANILVAKPPGGDFDKGMPVVEMSGEAKPSPAKSTPSLATNCKPGTRFPSYPVLRQSDARPWQLHHKMQSDGRFRIVVFAGDISDNSQRDLVNELGQWLGSTLLPRFPTMALSIAADPHGGTVKFRTAKHPSVIDVLLVHSAPREEVELLEHLHETYHPFDPDLGWDYDKVFVDGPSYHEGDGQAYKNYGVDAKLGALVVVRPDGYTGLVTSLGVEGQIEVDKWFGLVLREISSV